MSTTKTPSRSASQSRRHSRRSTGTLNFSHMSVSPLTTASITESDFAPQPRRSGSYIQGASAPITPRILSRTQSSSRVPTASDIDIPKSKSASQLLSGAATPSSSEWMHRTGAALSSETRESKGQSWLMTRHSSTSLVREAEPEERAYRRSFEGSSTESPMWDADANLELENGEVDAEEEEVELGQGFGLGQLIDRVVGWSLFADDEESEDEYTVIQSRPQKPRAIRLAKPTAEDLREQRRKRDESEGWQDPAWVFDIAAKVLF